MFETLTPVGEVKIVRENLHGTMINCLVTPYENPEEWFFKQFPSKEAIENWAIDNHFIIKQKEDENASSGNHEP